MSCKQSSARWFSSELRPTACFQVNCFKRVSECKGPRQRDSGCDRGTRPGNANGGERGTGRQDKDDHQRPFNANGCVFCKGNVVLSGVCLAQYYGGLLQSRDCGPQDLLGRFRGAYPNVLVDVSRLFFHVVLYSVFWAGGPSERVLPARFFPVHCLFVGGVFCLDQT